MDFRLFFLLFFLLFGRISFAKDGNIFSDTAMFKIQKHVVFYSEFKTFSNDLKSFKCLKPKSGVLQKLKISSKVPADAPRILADPKSFKANHAYLLKILKLMKLKIFSGRYDITFQKDLLLGYGHKKCGLGNFKNWPIGVQKLFQLDLYLLERFSANQNQVSKDTDKNKNALVTFIDTIDKTTKHEFYY